jgi:hypothetical protein
VQNIGITVQGVSLSRRGSGRLVTRLDTPPFSHRHHPVSAIAVACSRAGILIAQSFCSVSGGTWLTA